MRQVPYDFPGDPELAAAVAKEAENRDDTWVLASDDPYLKLFDVGVPQLAEAALELTAT